MTAAMSENGRISDVPTFHVTRARSRGLPMNNQSGTAEPLGHGTGFSDHVAGSRNQRQTKDMTVIAAVDASYTRLTPHNTAVLLVDHQIGPLWELQFAACRRSVVTLAELARRLGLPTIITAIGIETWGPIIPELTDAFEEAPHIVRTSVNAWEESAVRTAIEKAKRKKLVIAGGAGAPSVTLCALSAAAAGYDVYCVIDASAQLGHDAIARLSRDGVIVTTTALIHTEILGDPSTRRRRSR